MATEFDDSEHWGLFLTALTLTSSTGKAVRMSELVLAALRAAGVFDNMVDGTTPPTTDKLWLDKNSDPAILKQWDATGSSWVVMTFDRLFARAAVTLMTVTGGTGNAIVVGQPAGFRSDNLYSFVPTSDNTGAATIQVSGVGTYPARYADNSDVEAGEFTAGRQNILLFTGSRFTVLFQTSDLNAATSAAQQAALDAADARDDAQGYATDASNSATLANAWANTPEDTDVPGAPPGSRSAFHWMMKAAGVVAGGIASAIHAATAKSTPVDADELGIADSAASWALKKLTWLAVRLGVFVQASVSIARSATVNIGAASSFFVTLTGTTTITAFDNVAEGTLRLVQFSGAGTLTNNASIILPTAANITTAANDFALFRSEGSGVWRCVWYRSALATSDWTTGTKTAPGMPTPAQIAAAIAAAADVKAWVNFNGTGTVAIRGSKNVSSITDNGSGDYTVNFTSALADANFTAVCSAKQTNSAGFGSSNAVLTAGASVKATGSVRVASVSGTTGVDAEVFDVIVTR